MVRRWWHWWTKMQCCSCRCGPRCKRIRILICQPTVTAHEVKGCCLILWAPILHHYVGFWKLFFVQRKSVLEALHALLFSSHWLLVTPVAPAEALRGNTAALECLATFCLRHGWRSITRNAQSLAYSWIVADASGLNRSQIPAEANDHSFH